MKKLIIIFLLIISFNILKAQVYTIDSIINTIKINNPELQMYDLQISAINTYASGATAWEAPQVGAGLYMVPYMFDKDMGSLMFSFEQMIPNRSELKANQNLMLGMSSVENENKNYEFNQLVYQAKTLYNELIILKKKQTLLVETENIMTYIITTSETRYTYQDEKLNNIYKANAELYGIENMKVMNENEIQQKIISLNTLMNRNKNYIFDIDTIYEIKDYENQLIDTTQINDFRSDLKVFDQSANVMLLKQQLEQVKYKPDFGIKYDHAFGFGNQPNQFSIMAMMTIPIAPWSSKMYKANIAGMNLEIETIEKQKQSMFNEITEMISKIQSEIKAKKVQVDLYEKKILPALQNNYETTLLAYEENTEELFMVLDAWETLYMAKLEYYNQLQELLLLQIEFEKEMEIN